MATLNTAYAVQSTVLDRLLVKIEGALSALIKFRAVKAEEARVYAELAVLSDRELSDLGLSRFDLRQIAKEAARA